MRMPPGETDDAQHTGYQQGREGAQHVDFTVCEVDQFDDAVHQRIAQGDEGIDAAACEAAEEKFDKVLEVHAVTGAAVYPGAAGKRARRPCLRARAP